MKKFGFLAVVGRPNVGKSTLINAIMGRKYLIASHHPQTTQNAIRLIFSYEHHQFILVDTPGLHDQHPFLINEYMNQSVYQQMDMCDALIWVIDALRFTKEDENVLKKIQEKSTQQPVFLIINKIDLLDSIEEVLPLLKRFQDMYNFAAIVPVCAKKRHNIQTLIQALIPSAVNDGWLFDGSQAYDCHEFFIVSEFIREAVIRRLRQEIVYAVGIDIRCIEKKEKCLHIDADIWLDKASQKPIVIGKGGHLLKSIGIDARRSIEGFLRTHVFLRLWVTIKPNWRNKQHLIAQAINKHASR